MKKIKNITLSFEFSCPIIDNDTGHRYGIEDISVNKYTKDLIYRWYYFQDGLIMKKMANPDFNIDSDDNKKTIDLLGIQAARSMHNEWQRPVTYSNWIAECNCLPDAKRIFSVIVDRISRKIYYYNVFIRNGNPDKMKNDSCAYPDYINEILAELKSNGSVVSINHCRLFT